MVRGGAQPLWGCRRHARTWRSDRRRITKFGSTVSVTVDGTTLSLTREEARTLREALAEELVETREFVHTAGTHRADGTYEVARRRAESAGNATVFDSPRALADLFAGLPAEFTAADVEHPGVSAGRRHLVVRHLIEHPAFPCELAARQPLTARKR